MRKGEQSRDWEEVNWEKDGEEDGLRKRNWRAEIQEIKNEKQISLMQFSKNLDYIIATGGSPKEGKKKET